MPHLGLYLRGLTMSSSLLNITCWGGFWGTAGGSSGGGGTRSSSSLGSSLPSRCENIIAR